MSAEPSSSCFTIHSSLLFNPRSRSFVKNVSLEIDPRTGSITDVFTRKSNHCELWDGDIDLRGKVVMPGFVDAHTHIFLHSYGDTSSTVQERDESIVERIVRATNHLRSALLSGYTTYRDLGTEGLQSFDTNLRDCVNRGLTPGPRLFVATEALASSGSYEVRSENVMVQMPRISDTCDGVAGVRAAVRRRVGAGADVIKFYADYRRKIMRFPPPPSGAYGAAMYPPSNPNPAAVMFSQEEMDAIVQEARFANLPVAAHSGTLQGALMATKAGVDSIEHGQESTDELFTEMKKRGTIFVPTLSVLESLPNFPEILAQTKRAHDLGVRFAAGGDTGAFPHGDGVRELQHMIKAGIPLEDVLEACMVGGWESCGKDKSGFRFGWFEKGCRADIIALETDPREDVDALRKVDFVMKDGKVWKQDGLPVGMIDQLMDQSNFGRRPRPASWELV